MLYYEYKSMNHFLQMFVFFTILALLGLFGFYVTGQYGGAGEMKAVAPKAEAAK